MKKKKKEEVKPELYEVKDKNIINQNYKLPLLDARRWKNVFLDKFKGNECIIINMELTNGMHTHFLVKTSYDGFSYKGGSYLFDTDCKYYDTSYKNYCLDYHQDFVLPVKRTIPVGDIQKTIDNAGITEIENATNPSTLERFKQAKIAEGIMKGQQMDEIFQRIKVAIYIAATSSIIHLLLFVFKTGMLNSIKIPGVN